MTDLPPLTRKDFDIVYVSRVSKRLRIRSKHRSTRARPAYLKDHNGKIFTFDTEEQAEAFLKEYLK